MLAWWHRLSVIQSVRHLLPTKIAQQYNIVHWILYRHSWRITSHDWWSAGLSFSPTHTRSTTEWVGTVCKSIHGSQRTIKTSVLTFWVLVEISLLFLHKLARNLVQVTFCEQMPAKVTPSFHQMLVRCICAPLRQQSWFVSTLVNVCASTVCGCIAFRIRHSYAGLLFSADTQDFYFCQMAEHNAAIQHRTDCAGQTTKYTNKIKHLVWFLK